MALADLILNKGEIVMTETSSSVGIYGIDSTIIVGEISLVSQVSNRDIGEIVSFDKSKSEGFQVDGDTAVYYLTKENEIGFSEPVAP